MTGQNLPVQGEGTKAPPLAPVRAGVVGLGVGEAHLRALQGIEGVTVTAICDQDARRLDEVGARYDVAMRHSHYRAVTEDPEIDLVCLCSFDDGHAEQTISALNAGKHVMVEKPVVLYREEAAAVLEALQRSGRKLTSNLILRQSPRFRRLKRMMAAGEFGTVFHLEGDYLHQILWKLTEGWRGRMDFYCTFYGGGIHLVDLMRWLMAEEVMEVAAMSNDLMTRGTAYRYPDFFLALLRFASGAIGKCASSLAPQRPKFHALTIHGSRASFVNDRPHGHLHRSDDPAESVAVTDSYPGMEKGDLLPDFVAAIREDRDPAVTATDIFRVMDICFAVREAAETGRTVPVRYLI